MKLFVVNKNVDFIPHYNDQFNGYDNDKECATFVINIMEKYTEVNRNTNMFIGLNIYDLSAYL